MKLPEFIARWFRKPKTESVNVKVSVAIMITRDMRQQLYDLRYTRIEVDRMSPEEAQRILTLR